MKSSNFYVLQKEEDGREARNLSRKYGYPVEQAPPDQVARGVRFVVKAPCGCSWCNDGAQSGHFACSAVALPAAMLQAEEQGLVTRSYDNGAWRWLVC